MTKPVDDVCVQALVQLYQAQQSLGDVNTQMAPLLDQRSTLLDHISSLTATLSSYAPVQVWHNGAQILAEIDPERGVRFTPLSDIVQI